MAGLPLGLWQRIAGLVARRDVSLALGGYAVGTDIVIAWHGFGFALRAAVDEPAHLATALVVLGAIIRFRGSPPEPMFGWTMLGCSVLIDVDHLPQEFGSPVLTSGTPRPYTHALWIVILLGLAAIAASRQPGRPRSRVPASAGKLLAGATAGVAAHFLRDLATAPMSLWWPISKTAIQVPYWWYVLALLAFGVLPFREHPARVRS